MDGWMHKWKDGLNAWVDGQMDGWIDGWMDVWMGWVPKVMP